MAGKAFKKLSDKSTEESRAEVKEGIEFGLSLNRAMNKADKDKIFLAESLKIKRFEVEKWLCGFSKPSDEIIKQIEDLFGEKLI